MGTSGVSIFRSGLDGAGSGIAGDGPAATGCTSPDVGIFIVCGCFARGDLYAQIPAPIASTTTKTREVLKTYLVIAVSLQSEFQYEPTQLRDLQASLRIRALG